MRVHSMYSIEPVPEVGAKSGPANLIHVEAQSPVGAAEKALGERLSASGSSGQLRCRVWWLDDQFRTISLPLYAAE